MRLLRIFRSLGRSVTDDGMLPREPSTEMIRALDRVMVHIGHRFGDSLRDERSSEAPRV